MQINDSLASEQPDVGITSRVRKRINEIKQKDQVARELYKFTFVQFLKIIGKVDIELGEMTSQRSDVELISKSAVQNIDNRLQNEENKTHLELQQSLNYDDSGRAHRIPDDKKFRNIRDEIHGKDEPNLNLNKRTPRLQNNIVVKRHGKSSSLEKSNSKKLSPQMDKREFIINASNSNRISGLAAFNS